MTLCVDLHDANICSARDPNANGTSCLQLLSNVYICQGVSKVKGRLQNWDRLDQHQLSLTFNDKLFPHVYAKCARPDSLWLFLRHTVLQPHAALLDVCDEKLVSKAPVL